VIRNFDIRNLVPVPIYTVYNSWFCISVEIAPDLFCEFYF
jgi:hypothetical protein